MSHFLDNIAIVVSEFHGDVTEQLLQSALATLQENQLEADCISVIKVPGAIEIPIAAQRFLETQQHAAVICLGAVIYGETRHFDYVCQQVSYGCQRLALDHHTPVIFGVLTTNNKAQALARANGEHSDMGRDAAITALTLLQRLREIPQH